MYHKLATKVTYVMFYNILRLNSFCLIVPQVFAAVGINRSFGYVCGMIGYALNVRYDVVQTDEGKQ